MPHPRLAFVTCASDPEQLRRSLLASECLSSHRHRLALYFDSPSAGWAFNQELEHCQGDEWLVWVHQDVYLPPGWDQRFLASVETAKATIPNLAVLGVYGIAHSGNHRAGHILDRGQLLRESIPLPCEASSLDEVMIAVRAETRLTLDPTLGFNFYGTDIVLSARERGWRAAIVDACCEHWSDTPTSGPVSPAFAERIIADARVFENKWRNQLPVMTSCFDIREVGNVERFMERHFSIDAGADAR